MRRHEGPGGVTDATRRHRGETFDEAAAEYDRCRPEYPDELVDRACAVAGLAAGDHVLEIGCGSGQLTRRLVEHGLRVTAVEPGERLLALAARSLAGSGRVELVNARFEDAELPAGRFRAVFSASAFHWVDPDVGWRKSAATLAPDGTLALLQYLGLLEERSAADQAQLLAALARIVPEIASGWPVYRDLATTIAGAHARRANVSEVWSWLGSHDLARAQAADLFGDVQVAAVPTLLEQTAAELNALLATASFWRRIAPEQRAALERASVELHDRIGRPIRSSTVAVLVTARRRAAADAAAG
jgi:SAM-dependent methyltransferase